MKRWSCYSSGTATVAMVSENNSAWLISVKPCLPSKYVTAQVSGAVAYLAGVASVVAGLGLAPPSEDHLLQEEGAVVTSVLAVASAQLRHVHPPRKWQTRCIAQTVSSAPCSNTLLPCRQSAKHSF